MTATKETTFASSFVVILTVITTMTMNDDIVQGRSVTTESLLTHSILSRTSHGVSETSSFALVSEACDCTICTWKAMRAVQ